jgi:Fe-S-cluster containining protein
MTFKCDCCGLCCRSLKKVPALANFDRGDGVCIHLRDDNLCSIYEHRPEICNVDLMYVKFYSSIYTKEEYYKLNEKQCEKIKSWF